MAKVDIGTGTADFDTRAPVVVGQVTAGSNRSRLFYIRSTTPGQVNPDSYLLMLVAFTTTDGIVKSPLICKYFPDAIEMVYLVPVPRVRDTPNQLVTVGFLPREFYRNRAPLRQMDFTIAWEDTRSVALGAIFPG